MNDWREVLQNEGLPLCCSLTFKWQNKNIQRVILNGSQISFTKASRKFAGAWIKKYRLSTMLTNIDQSIDIEFHNGAVNGVEYFGNSFQEDRSARNIMLNAIMTSLA